MKAAYIEQPGPPENIIYGDLPQPQPKDAEVLVRVKALSVNPIDTYLRGGANYWELPRPYIIGSDLAGEVVARGPKATRYQVGDRVWGSNQGLLGRQGCFSEFCAVDERWLYPTPDSVSDEAAAACALVGITAHLGLFDRAQLRSGESVFVHGGSGGVGAMVVQMAKAAGARVFTTAGGPDKVRICQELGADRVVNYKTDDTPSAARQFAPNGFDVVWETTREPDFDQLVDRLAEGGRLLLMAGRDARPPFPVGPFYVKGCSLLGFVMFKASAEKQQQCAEAINRWLADGRLKPQIGAVFPLAEAAAAHRLQEDNTLRHSGTLTGKIVLKP
jgi:NADPH2:quinone reductase